MEKKLHALRELDEQTLRTEVYVPLLRKITKIRHVDDRHGSNEFGIDASFYEEDAFGAFLLTGTQLKVGDINLVASSRQNVIPLITQATTALSMRHKHVFTKRQEFLARLYIVTSGRISDQTKQAILEGCQNKNVAFMDGQELLNQIEKHMPEYFAYQNRLVRNYFSVARAQVARIQVFGPGRLEERDLVELFVPPDLSVGHETSDVLSLEPFTGNVNRRCTISDLLTMDGSVVILGDQHAGKTVLLKHLFVTLVDQHTSSPDKARIPISATFREMIDSDYNITELMRTKLRLYGAEDLASALETLLTHGKITLLLDGLNEVSMVAERAACLDSVKVLLRSGPDNLVIWTSRVLGSVPDEYRVANQVFAIQPFKPSQLYRLIDKLLKDPAAARDAIQRALEDNLDVCHLPRTPLLCSLIVSICSEQEGFIASNASEIFEKYTELLLGKWTFGPSDQSRFPYQIRVAFLSHLALEMLTMGRYSVSIENVEALAKGFFETPGLDGDGAELVSDLADTGVLRRKDDRLEFCARSFLEFFAARRLAELPNGDDHVLTRIEDRAYAHTIVFYAGLKKDCSSLIRAALEKMPQALRSAETELPAGGGVRLGELIAIESAAAEEEGAETVSREVRPLEAALQQMDESYDFAAKLRAEMARQSAHRGGPEARGRVRSSAQNLAREAIFGELGHWTTVLALIAKNASFTSQEVKEIVVRRSVGNFAPLCQ